MVIDEKAYSEGKKQQRRRERGCWGPFYTLTTGCTLQAHNRCSLQGRKKVPTPQSMSPKHNTQGIDRQQRVMEERSSSSSSKN